MFGLCCTCLFFPCSLPPCPKHFLPGGEALPVLLLLDAGQVMFVLLLLTWPRSGLAMLPSLPQCVKGQLLVSSHMGSGPIRPPPFSWVPGPLQWAHPWPFLSFIIGLLSFNTPLASTSLSSETTDVCHPTGFRRPLVRGQDLKMIRKGKGKDRICPVTAQCPHGCWPVIPLQHRERPQGVHTCDSTPQSSACHGRVMGETATGVPGRKREDSSTLG